jgi:hypothetical protein
VGVAGGLLLLCSGPAGWVLAAGIVSGAGALTGGGLKLGNWLYNKSDEDKISNLEEKEIKKV